MGRKRVTVIKQSKTGRNLVFKDNHLSTIMDRNEFVRNIQEGKYPNYTVANIGGILTPKATPDKDRNNNLG